jgi:hypothetical protein
MAKTKQQVGSIKDALTDFVRKGQFDYAFIADDSGLPMVCAGSDMSTSENQAALLSRIKNIIGMVDAQKGLGTIDEIVFNVTGQKKVICRNFVINKRRLILAITMEAHKSYRRLTGSFVHQLQVIWDL